MSFSSHLIVIILLGVVGLLNLLPAVGTSTQGQDKIIEKQSFSKEPVKIKAVKIKKGGVKLGEKFVDDEDWFKDLTVSVENTSGKAVSYISILVLFPKSEDDETAPELPFGESLKYGISPFAPIGSVMSNQVQPIPAGSSINLTLSEELYGIVKQFLQKNKYPANINKIKLSLEDIGFVDGTVWSAGQLWRRDPSNPEKWIRVEQPQDSIKNHAAKFRLSNLLYSKKLLSFHNVSSMKPQIQESVCGYPIVPYYPACGTGCVVRNDQIVGLGIGEMKEIFRFNRRCEKEDLSAYCASGAQAEAWV